MTRVRKAKRSIAARWRRALLGALMLVLAFVPVAKAACDLEALAVQLGSAGVALKIASEALSPHDDEALCCDHEPGAFVVQAKSPIADATLLPSAAAAHLDIGDRPLYVRAELPSSIYRTHAAAPPEPVFRRVPRLLI
jgi:hypothetical protein